METKLIRVASVLGGVRITSSSFKPIFNIGLLKQDISVVRLFFFDENTCCWLWYGLVCGESHVLVQERLTEVVYATKKVVKTIQKVSKGGRRLGKGRGDDEEQIGLGRQILWHRGKENIFTNMASTSSNSPSSQITSDQSAISISSTLSLPKTCTKHVASKIENLVEYSYVPDSPQISESSMPLISPYQLYRRGNTFTHNLIAQWQREGYTHLHLGGVRLILTLHGQKGLPVTARLALLDTRFKEYQHAVIGTVLTTLHAGSALLTFYPNFNLSLQDPNLPTAFKVQIQLQGAEQVVTAKMATLHHQLVYRLQNHVLDLPSPQTSSDALMILADTETILTIVQIPRQIPKQELLKLMLMEWLFNYEKFHQNSQPIHTSKAFFEKRVDGTVKMTFQPPSEPTAPRISFSYTSMITAVSTAQENIPIHSFSSKGYPIYPDKLDGHFLWDVPGSHMTEEPRLFKAVLNWQFENARAQNSVLQSLDAKVDSVASQVHSTDGKVDSIAADESPCLSTGLRSSSDDKKQILGTIGSLRDWCESLGQYRQLQFVQIPDTPTALGLIYEQYLDLDFHYKRMYSLYYKLNGFNDPALIHVFVASLPKELLPELQRQLKVHNLEDDYDDFIAFALDDSSESSDSDNMTIIHTLFQTKLITKKLVGIQFFPNCVLWVNIVGSDLPDKDLLIGFDILHLIKKLQITASGIRFKQMFQPYTDVLCLFALSDTPLSYTSIKNQLLPFCPESHNLFSYSRPLWKNQDFFIKLPFKLNEDINPTKAIHPGMTPSDLNLAQAECSQLLAQGLIEPTHSDWACQAFYVEKRSELLRGKKRLVIDYQPLNCFLKDDKFPLPKIRTLFVHIRDAKIFSKFDLKAEFRQLGIHPSDHHKTTFCIPNAHCQWTVMPFGLKVEPSLFQKTMIKIFEPILHHGLIYIDDILLFSKDHDSYQKLFCKFLSIVDKHGIMLSAKKSIIGQPSVEFLGMILKDGNFQPRPHIAQELLHFPDQDLSRKQIQQFLGIVNYLKDFIPHVARHTSHLSIMLKKSTPPLGPI
ncbi:hypothetical protein KPL71_026436 [Citrus sinensis]|uniref:Uncharacterized protein n=1 Tax=Citrus sinensis TaxID=2711 RepID=A0ACB8HZE9_CITSI|nr:hypothetical protein KPL71_026436 [Citrus sinensis]